MFRVGADRPPFDENLSAARPLNAVRSWGLAAAAVAVGFGHKRHNPFVVAIAMPSLPGGWTPKGSLRSGCGERA